MHNAKFATTAFATFSPYKSWSSRLLSWSTLLLAETHTAAARKPKFLHTAQFVPVSPEQLKRAKLSGEGLHDGALLFMSSFNGSSDDYFRGFSEQLSEVMHDVWTWCVRWKSAEIVALKGFITAYERRCGSFYNAYPEGSTRLRAALVLQRELDELHALALSADCTPEKFAAAFQALSLRQWGNAE